MAKRPKINKAKKKAAEKKIVSGMNALHKEQHYGKVPRPKAKKGKSARAKR